MESETIFERARERDIAELVPAYLTNVGAYQGCLARFSTSRNDQHYCFSTSQGLRTWWALFLMTRVRG